MATDIESRRPQGSIEFLNSRGRFPDSKIGHQLHRMGYWGRAWKIDPFVQEMLRKSDGTRHYYQPLLETGGTARDLYHNYAVGIAAWVDQQATGQWYQPTDEDALDIQAANIAISIMNNNYHTPWREAAYKKQSVIGLLGENYSKILQNIGTTEDVDLLQCSLVAAHTFPIKVRDFLGRPEEEKVYSLLGCVRYYVTKAEHQHLLAAQSP